MDTLLVWLIVAVATGWLAMTVIVARRAYRWHRSRSRPAWAAGPLSVAAGLLWPLTLYVWDLDWAITDRDRRHSGR